MTEYIEAAQMTAEAEEDEISLLDILQVLAENARLLIFVPLIAGLAALGVAFLITPTFTATTRIVTPQQQQSMATAALQQLGALAGAAGAIAGIKNPADMYVGLLKSRTIADRMIDRFRLMDVYEDKYREDARKDLDKKTSINAGKDGLITIEVDDHDPKQGRRDGECLCRGALDADWELGGYRGTAAPIVL